MKGIFDYSKIYAGTAVIGGNPYSCSLSFPDHHILFKVISDRSITLLSQTNLEFHGHISTELGIMNYKAGNVWQSGLSHRSTQFSNEEFIANSLLVTHENNNLHSEKFGQVNLCYHQLEAIGDFVKIENNDWETLKFNFKRIFENIVFMEENHVRLSLENPINYNFSFNDLRYFSLDISPYFSYRPDDQFTISESGAFIKGLGWFIELLFGIRQYPTDVFLFENSVDEFNSNGQKPYYFINRELILNKNKIKKALYPVFKLNELQYSIPVIFTKWHTMDHKQRTLCNLFFSELYSDLTSSDDKFKNLCAIIQGLDSLGTTVEAPGAKGEMNKKLHKATNPIFETLVLKYMTLPVLHRLYILVGDQRDFYQHLNKPIKFDLNAVSGGLTTINAFLKLIIKANLLLFLGLDNKYISGIIDWNLNLQSRNLKALSSELQTRYQL